MASKDQQTPNTAIVTGSSRGIGRAIALRLADDGFDVCINDIQANRPGIDEVVDSIKSKNRQSIGIVADVSKRSEVSDLVHQAVDALGPLAVMVANAGIAQVKPVLELTEEDMERMFNTNLFGLFNCYQLAAKQFIKQGTKGKLLGAASIVAYRPFAFLSHYSASKWAVRGLTQAFAMEVASHNITCNAYAPGMVGTAILHEIDEKIGELTGAAKGETLKKFREGILMGRFSVPEDVAHTVSFLAGGGSDYMTGQTLIIDGGTQFS